MEETNQKQIRRTNNSSAFYFIEPESGSDANETAMKLMQVNGVREVHITEGAYGFIVKAKAEHAKELQLQLPKSMKVQSAASHCRYSK